MPTPIRVFAEIAARVGGVDPEDMAAVERFYVEVLPGLETAQIRAILGELLERECEGGEKPCGS